MRKILLKHIFTNMTFLFVILSICIAVFLGITHFFGANEPMTLEKMSSDGSLSWVGMFLIIGFQLRLCELPDSVYIMPISRMERIRMVKILFITMWIGMSLLIMFASNFINIIVLIREDTLEGLLAMKVILMVVMVLSSLYLLCYVNYFSVIESFQCFTCWIVPVFQFTLLDIFGEIMLSDGVSGMITICIISALFWLVNLWFHKNYFNEMVQFYADYESSRKLVKKKVSA